MNLHQVNYPAIGNTVEIATLPDFFWEVPRRLSSTSAAYLNVSSHVIGSDRPLPACRPLRCSLTPTFHTQPLSRLTDYSWFRAWTDSAQATINTAAIISVSSNLPTVQPDDVNKITAEWEMEGSRSDPFFNRVCPIKKSRYCGFEVGVIPS